MTVRQAISAPLLALIVVGPAGLLGAVVLGIAQLTE